LKFNIDNDGKLYPDTFDKKDSEGGQKKGAVKKGVKKGVQKK